MISGFFGVEDALFFEIELIASSGLELPVDAMLDTGFSAMFTARGEAEFKLYLGQVRIDGQDFNIPVHVGEELSEVLLGRQWLQSKRLVVDMQSGILTLG
jgi:predicted aspartyl protease